MKVLITQEINKEYYTEYYSEWIKYRSKYKKWQHLIGFISMSVALVIYLVDQSLTFISVGLLVFGTLMVYEFYSSKSKWLNERLKSNIMGAEVTLIFEEDKIQIIGPSTEMSGKWTIFKDAVETEKGLILTPENGISVYLQKKSFGNKSDIEAIVKRVKEANAVKL